MTNCRLCMQPIEGSSATHPECDDLKESGWTDAQIIRKAEGRLAQVHSRPRPLTRRDIVIGVMCGNLLAALICGVIYLIILLVNDFSAPVPH